MASFKSTRRSSEVEKASTQYTASLKLDKHGILLSPQPSSDPKGPLTWPRSLEWVVPVQISALSFMTCLSASMVSLAFVPLSRFLHRSLSDTAYTTSIVLATTGISPFSWNLLPNMLGRRPIWLLCLLGSVATPAASGAAHGFAELLNLRALAGVFTGIPRALGLVTVCDLFFAHERGFYMAMYAAASIGGAHAAPLLGGFVARAAGWRWTFFAPTVGFAALLLPFVLSVPETLFSHTAEMSLCYKSQASHTGTILNFFRNLFGVCVAFYDHKMVDALGFQVAWIVLAMVDVTFFFPMLLLFWKGKQWRERLGPPI